MLHITHTEPLSSRHDTEVVRQIHQSITNLSWAWPLTRCTVTSDSVGLMGTEKAPALVCTQSHGQWRGKGALRAKPVLW